MGTRLEELYERLNEIEAWTAEARASTILAGLQFAPHMQQMKTKELSGGTWLIFEVESWKWSIMYVMSYRSVSCHIIFLI